MKDDYSSNNSHYLAYTFGRTYTFEELPKDTLLCELRLVNRNGDGVKAATTQQLERSTGF